MRPVADSGLLVGFLDPADQHHAWARKCFDELRTALTTCEAMLAETEYLVPGSGPDLMEMVRRGTLHVVPLLPAEAESLGTLMTRYGKMQFADACIVRLAKSCQRHWSIRQTSAISRSTGAAAGS